MTDDGKFFLYPCGSCPVYYRSTDQSLALRLLHRHEQAHRHEVIMRISTGGRPEHGRAATGLMVFVTLFGMFVWGWSHSSARPNGATLLAIAVLAVVAGLLTIVGATVRGYWVLERRDGDYTENQIEHVEPAPPVIVRIVGGA